jgi:fructose-bisphosphate aldolase, class II
MLVNSNDLLRDAKKNKYAIPQFNINNLEWTKYILEECEQLKTPVILGVSEGAAKYMGGYNVISNMVKGLIMDLNITIPVVLHLDHGSSVESCKKAIDSGFTSVMIDASKYDLENNIAITKEVVAYAKPKNVSVEGELGHIGGSEDNVTNDIAYVNVKDAIIYVKETNLDSFAPALGSVHGLYKGEPNLKFDLMEEINSEIEAPMVLHGGTGIYDEQIKQAINNGITKININTELQIEWSKAVREFLMNDSKTYDPRKLIGSGEKNIKQAVKNKVELFNSLNKRA